MMVAWRHALSLHIVVRRGILYLVAFWDGVPTLWGPPLGDDVNREDLRYAFRLLRALCGPGVQPSILYAWKEYALWPALLRDPAYSVSFQRNEYLYFVPDLAHLGVPKLRKKRQERNRFEQRFTPTSLLYDPKLADECVDLLDRWTKWRQQALPSEFVLKFEMEAQVCRDALTSRLEMQGVVARVAGRVEAFSLGVAHTSHCFNCLFEKANYQLPGASAFIFAELARVLAGQYDEINAGGDWAIPYLAKAKLAWHPSRVEEAFTITDAASLGDEAYTASQEERDGAL
jgi:hypothetical protein